MGIVSMWDTPDKLAVRVEFESEWSWAQLEAAISEIDGFIASVTHRVDVILDVEGTSIPKDFLSAAKNLLANPEPRSNEGRRIVVGATKVIRTAYTTLSKAFGDRLAGREVLFAETLGDARAILRGLRLEDNKQR